MARWLICIVAMLMAGPVAAADVTALPVVEAGLFRARTTGQIASPQAVDERTELLDDVVFYSLTSKVPARLGIRFGTRFRVVGTPANQTVTLRSVWRIPEPGIQKPETGTLYRRSIADTAATIGALGMRGYTFDAAWEIRCGEWIQEVWFGERKLLSRTFTVEGCEGLPISAREPQRCAASPGDAAACRAG
jgi:hypothetical protein